MRYFLMAILFLFVTVSAQPLPNPYRVIQLSGSIASPRITLRDSSLADVFYIHRDTNNEQFAHHAVTSMTGHQLLAGPDTLQHTAGWTQEIGDVISRGNEGYLALLYEEEPMQPYVLSHNRTAFAHGANATPIIRRIDSGMAIGMHTGALLCDTIHRNSAFHLQKNLGGGWLANWIREGCWNLGGNFTEPDYQPQALRLDPNGDVAGGYEGCSGYNGFLTNALYVPIAEDSVLMLSLHMDLNRVGYPALLCTFPQTEQQTPITVPCTTVVADFRKTNSGHFLLLTGGAYYDETLPSEIREIHRDGRLEAARTLNIPRFDAVAYEPDYGFAVLSLLNSTTIMLARVDTSGNEVRPLSVFYEAVPGRAILQIDATLNSNGRIAVVWTERDDDVANANEIMAGYVNWDTELAAGDPQPAPVPSSFSLSAYPNPFNNETKIDYSLAVSGIFDLSVYNLEGRLVANLRSGKAAAGNYSTIWRPAGGSGVYFVRLQSGKTIQTLKTVYLK